MQSFGRALGMISGVLRVLLVHHQYANGLETDSVSATNEIQYEQHAKRTDAEKKLNIFRTEYYTRQHQRDLTVTVR